MPCYNVKITIQGVPVFTGVVEATDATSALITTLIFCPQNTDPKNIGIHVSPIRVHAP